MIKSKMMITHKQGVEIAYKWLLKNGRVGIAFKELVSVDREIPDVIGFDSWQSILIEVKVSRSDFIKDKKKIHRTKGMGNWRFFACPKGLIKKEELPEKWGLIYIDEKGRAKVEYDCRVKKVPFEYDDGNIVIRTTGADENWFDTDMKAERAIFYTALRRLFIKGYVKHIYDKKYNRKTTANELIKLNETLNT
jgi:hypothetical protein